MDGDRFRRMTVMISGKTVENILEGGTLVKWRKQNSDSIISTKEIFLSC